MIYSRLLTTVDKSGIENCVTVKGMPRAAADKCARAELKPQLDHLRLTVSITAIESTSKHCVCDSEKNLVGTISQSQIDQLPRILGSDFARRPPTLALLTEPNPCWSNIETRFSIQASPWLFTSTPISSFRKSSITFG